MKRRDLGVIVACAVAASLAVTGAQVPLRPIATIALPNVSGRIDHLAFDAPRQRLFVAALGNNSVEVIDTAKGTHLRSLSGFHEPQGIAVVPDLDAVAIANGGSGTLQLIDAESLQARWTATVGDDADNVRYDAAANRLYVAAEGGLFGVDSRSGRLVQRIPINGHPESFQLESQGARVFANLPGASLVVAADRRTATVVSRWTTGACGSNYPMALDESTARLFIGCRRPARLALFDTKSGKEVGSSAIAGDTDDLFYDETRHQIYVIGGEGFVDVFARSGDTLQRSAHIATRGGARTGLWVQSQNRLYVAVPARDGKPAEVRVFEAG